MPTDSAGLNPAEKNSESAKKQEDTHLADRVDVPLEATREHLKTQCLTLILLAWHQNSKVSIYLSRLLTVVRVGAVLPKIVFV